jgi:DNA invertase Pin-like site-specific DNA recombinase
MIAGYARADAPDDALDGQVERLSAAGAQRIWAEAGAGRGGARPELGRLIDELGPGDVLVVTAYDRVSGSLLGLTDVVGRLSDRGAGFRALAEGVDTTGAEGDTVLHLFSTLAAFERARISARTREGLAAARRLGRVGGRPPALTPQQRAEVRRMRDVEGRRIAEIARIFKVSANTIRRA